MKQVIWLCNVPTPKASEAFGWDVTSVGGWMFWLSERLGKSTEYKLNLIFKSNNVKEVIKKEYDGINYYAIPNFTPDIKKYSKKCEKTFEEIISSIKPDIIHIFGTEYSHTLAMINASIHLNVLEKCVISIQGLVSVYAKYYFGNLDEKEKKTVSLRDILKLNTLLLQKKNFEKRGIYEKEALKKVCNVIGRTDWDKALTKQFNPEVSYYFNNENLRDSFYENEWDYNKCQKHSLFLSQGHNPLKGLDVLLKALPQVLKYYPDTKVYVAGYKNTSKIKKSSYEKILMRLIKKNKLENNIEFLGMKNEKEMVDEYLRANLFICPSSIENSPNSVGEAMLLGTPVIASYVGGTSNLLKDKEEGYLYQSDADYMLAYYIIDLFTNIDKARSFSKKAREHALSTHNREKNFNELLKIYEIIIKNSN